MKKDVIISFVGTQENGDDKDKIELITEGSFYKKGTDYYVTYTESELTGLEGTTTTLKIQGKKITMLRYGTNTSQLVFEKGKHHICCYDTEFGTLSVGVWANKVSVNIDDNGGEIYADYNIDVDNNSIGKNDFKMQIRECH
ncbi:MAG: DUF1934 domain-containing protein [Clostridia bacterium]|nr:DUF1934 domain-containing protein [Clostridia bacterium]